MSRARVIQVTTDTDVGLVVAITVSRYPYASVHRPRAEDVPADIRDAVRQWLAEADKEAQS